ncbi:hypothetical protein AMTR_s00025p00171220 [Amborella trichopoda]|uniref:Uncharacterized protein n=1 Tax=Amborella trichopoda TaxID=13333 RepID=W1PYB9_AMBTC|nr:hypothetical protein AMTR_s00025p00171220 [Amborella trichopoda]
MWLGLEGLGLILGHWPQGLGHELGHIAPRLGQAGAWASLKPGPAQLDWHLYMQIARFRPSSGELGPGHVSARARQATQRSCCRAVTIKEIGTGKMTTLYNAKEAIFKLKTPALQDPKGVAKTESALVWSHLMKAITNKEWDNARDAKKAIEEKERSIRRERMKKGTVWVPKYFHLVKTEDNAFEVLPRQSQVPPAPIIAS